MPEEYDFIEKVRGQPYLEVQSTGEYVSLNAVVTQYDEEGKTPGEIADFFQMDVEDVENGIVYWREEDEIFEGPDDNDSEIGNAESPETIDAVGDFFRELIKRNGFRGMYVDDSPDSEYFESSTEERHLVWDEDDTEARIYAGVDEEDRGLLSFSVDGEEGPEMIVEEDVKDWLDQVYRNIVFETGIL